VSDLPYVVDERTGIAIVRPQGAGMMAPRVSGLGTITYRCHTCGELIPKHWEVLFVDTLDGYASPILPAVLPPTMTTHHDWHMAATQEA
jgi:hypothetical protein